MKRLLSFVVIAFLLVGCSKDDDGGTFDFNGTMEDIKSFVGNDLLEKMIDLGLEIHPGDNPPNVEGKYLMSPSVLENSTIPGDYPGKLFDDFLLEFLNQEGLNIEFIGEQTIGTAVGKGSFISGNDDLFTVYLNIIVKHHSGQTNEMEQIFIFSGQIAPEGIVDIQLALFMIENNGNSGVIENGQGRIIKDGDGLAERQPAGLQKIPLEGGVDFSAKVQE